MANPFDQFDSQEDTNPFSQFDGESQDSRPRLTADEFYQQYGDIPDIYDQIKDEPKKPEPTFGEKISAIGDTALSLGTGATSGVAGLFAGTIKGFVDELRSGEFGTAEAADRIEKKASEVMKSLTYMPEDELSKDYLKGFGEAVQPLAPLAGLSAPIQQISTLGRAATPQIMQGARGASQSIKPVTDAMKIPQAGQVAKAVFDYQSPAKQKIAKMIQQDPTNAKTARFKISKEASANQPAKGILNVLDSGGAKVSADKFARNAINQGFDEGVVASIKASSKADKSLMKKMLSIMKKGKSDAEFGSFNRPSDIVGNTLLDRIKSIRDANKKAGIEIGKEAKKLAGKDIDISNAVNAFSSKLDDLGVRLVPNNKGGLKPDFEISTLSPGDRGPIKEVIRVMNIKLKDGALMGWPLMK